MASYMYKKAIDKTKRLIAKARYVIIIVDEVTMVDNCHDPHHKACPCHLGEQGGHWG